MNVLFVADAQADERRRWRLALEAAAPLSRTCARGSSRGGPRRSPQLRQ